MKNSPIGRLELPWYRHPSRVVKAGNAKLSSPPSLQNLWTRFLCLNNSGERCPAEQAVSRLHFWARCSGGGPTFKTATWLDVYVFGNRHTSSANMVGMLQSYWQGLAEREGSQSFWKSKAECSSFLFFFFFPTNYFNNHQIYPHVLTWTLFFQARHVTVNNYGCKRNKSYGHIGTTMKWGRSVGKGKLWVVLE